MRTLLSAASLLTGLVLLGAPGFARAQCLTIPDGVGGAAVHCADGTTGHLNVDAGGGVSGMIGSQAVAGGAQSISTPSLAGVAPAPGVLNPDLVLDTAPRPPPSMAMPVAPASAAPRRPFPTYPDPEGAGLPGEE